MNPLLGEEGKMHLDAAARLVAAARDAAAIAGAVVASDPEISADNAWTAKRCAVNALNRLEAMGATRPDFQDAPPPAPAFIALDKLDTPAGRKLLVALERVSVLARAVDRERGWVDSDGESVGYAESLMGMALGLSAEIHGPKGRD